MSPSPPHPRHAPVPAMREPGELPFGEHKSRPRPLLRGEFVEVTNPTMINCGRCAVTALLNITILLKRDNCQLLDTSEPEPGYSLAGPPGILTRSHRRGTHRRSVAWSGCACRPHRVLRADHSSVSIYSSPSRPAFSSADLRRSGARVSSSCDLAQRSVAKRPAGEPPVSQICFPQRTRRMTTLTGHGDGCTLLSGFSLAISASAARHQTVVS